MSIGLMADRGIFVQFELRPEEDRAETMRVGHPVFKDVEYAVITPAGGGLTVEKIVTEQLLNEWKYGAGERKPPRPYLIGQYESWKAGNEPAANGIDIKNWPGATPAQVKTCLEAQLRTVEQLATAHEAAIARLGMGGRALKDKAIAYLKAAEGQGVMAEAMADMKTQMENMKAEMAALRETNERLARKKSAA